MSLKKLKNDLQKALESNKSVRIVDCYNSLGDHHRRVPDRETAIPYFQNGAEHAARADLPYEGSFSERALAECYAELGKRKEAIDHAQMFINLAEICGDKSQIQLSLHVYAYCMMKLSANGVAEDKDMVQAIVRSDQSLAYLSSHAKELEKSKEHGSVKTRTAKLYSIQSQIYCQMRRKSDAVRCYKAGIKNATDSDNELRYDLLLCGFDVCEPDEKLDISSKMVAVASKEQKGAALLERAHQKLLAHQVQGAFEDLRTAHSDHRELMKRHTEDDYHTLQLRLVLVYKLITLELEIDKAKKDVGVLHELIADIYYEYLQETISEDDQKDRQRLYEMALYHYKKMYSKRKDDIEGMKAQNSMALTYIDLRLFEDAMNVLRKILKCQIMNKTNKNEIIDTRLSLLTCYRNLKRDEDVRKSFDELNMDVQLPKQKHEFYIIMSEYWSDCGDVEKEHEFEQLAGAIDVGPDDKKTSGEGRGSHELMRMSNEKIISRIMKEMEREKEEEKFILKKNIRNQIGETKLHEAAKKDDADLVRRLCKLGYEINAKDNGGWTPLSEAVIAGHLDNVRVLLEYGADVNICSTQGFQSDDVEVVESVSNEKESLTPLMEACTNGSVDIARLLIEKGARIEMKDRRGWNALNHLRNRISSCDNDDEEKPALIEFEKHLRDIYELRNILTESFAFEPKRHRRSMTPERRIQPAKKKKQPRSIYSSDSLKENNDLDDIFGNKIRQRKRRLSDDDEESVKPLFKRPTTSSIERSDVRNSCRSPGFSISPRSGPLETSVRRRVEIDDDDVVEECAWVASFESSSRPFSGTLNQRRSSRETSESRSYPSMSPVSTRPSSRGSPLYVAVPSVSVDVSIVSSDGPVPKRNRFKYSLPRSSRIRDLRAKVAESVMCDLDVALMKHKSHVFLCDEANLTDEKNLPIEFDCRLQNVSALFEYFRITNEDERDNEVAELVREFDRSRHIDCSDRYLDERTLQNIARTVARCPIRDGDEIIVGIDRCRINEETSAAWNPIIRRAHSFSARCLFTKPIGLAALFKTEGESLPLRSIDVASLSLRDPSVLVSFLSSCPHVERLDMAGLRCAGTTTVSLSPIANVFTNFLNLRELNMSSSGWATEEDWSTILSNSSHLTKLIINSNNMSVRFDAGWMPQLRELHARDSRLDWHSFVEYVCLSSIRICDLTNCDMPSEFVEELKNTKQDECAILV